MKMVGLKTLLGAVLISCIVFAGPAWAGTLNFSGNSLGEGELSFNPGYGNTLTIGSDGTNPGALITQLLNTSGLCGGNCAISSGYMTLTSGVETSGGSGTYTFGAGGTIDIYGGIASLGIANGTLLLSATFSSGSTLVAGASTGVFSGNLNLASITLNPALGAYNFSGGSTAAITVDLSGTCSGGGPCQGSITTAGVSMQTTPEPASLSLLGTGLLAVGGVLRKKLFS